MPPKRTLQYKHEKKPEITSDQKAMEDRLKEQESELIALKRDFQKMLKENEELNAKLVKIPVYDTATRFVRKLDVIKVLKSNAKNEPDLKEWEIAITDKDIILKVTTLSNIHYEMSLSEAQQYQL